MVKVLENRKKPSAQERNRLIMNEYWYNVKKKNIFKFGDILFYKIDKMNVQ